MVDFKDTEKLEELAKEGKTEEYMGKPKKGSFAERKASGIKRSTVDYTIEQSLDIQEIAQYLKIPAQAVVKMAVHEFVIRHKTAMKNTG